LHLGPTDQRRTSDVTLTFPGYPYYSLGPEDVERVEQAIAKVLGGASEARALAENFADYQALARGESLRLEMFRAGLPRGVPVASVPNFARDVYDLASLAAMHAHLFGGKAAG
jgi:hypothetical protein